METIINQIFWLWVPLSLLPVWLRIALVTYVVIILSRPILVTLIPKLILLTSIILKKSIELLSYPLMLSISRLITKRRQFENHQIPLWVDRLEDICAILMKGFTKPEELLRKQTRYKIQLKKTFRFTAFLLAILVPLAIVNNPSQAYSKAWHTFDSWVMEEKVQKTLGYNRNPPQENIQTPMKSDEQQKLTLKEKFKEMGGNIRETPSLNGKIIDELFQNEAVTYLGEDQKDSTGITWLKIKTESGKEGWISERITEK